MKLPLLVAAGGFLGAICRFGLNNFIQARHHKSFPFGTFTINVTGSFLLGLLFAYRHLSSEVLFFLGTGFLGAYTTFSTYELEAVELIRRGRTIISLIYLVISVVIGIIFAYIGYSLGNYFY